MSRFDPENVKKRTFIERPDKGLQIETEVVSFATYLGCYEAAEQMADFVEWYFSGRTTKADLGEAQAAGRAALANFRGEGESNES